MMFAAFRNGQLGQDRTANTNEIVENIKSTFEQLSLFNHDLLTIFGIVGRFLCRSLLFDFVFVVPIFFHIAHLQPCRRQLIII